MANNKKAHDLQVARNGFLLKLGLAVVALLAVSSFVNAYAAQTSNSANNSITGSTGASGLQGIPGQNGQSAYELAVAAGFSGSDEEWLASLQGPRGIRGATGARGQRGSGGDVADAENGQQITYHFMISDFADSLIEIPTSNVSGSSTTLASKHLAGRALIYDENDNQVGTASASFISIQNADGIFTDVSANLNIDDGHAYAWSTPATSIDLELESIIKTMVTERTVTESIGGQTAALAVTADSDKIYFQIN